MFTIAGQGDSDTIQDAYSSVMPKFTGTLKLKVCEAVDLRPTEYATRHANVVGTQQQMLMDPYVAIDVDAPPPSRRRSSLPPQRLQPRRI